MKNKQPKDKSAKHARRQPEEKKVVEPQAKETRAAIPAIHIPISFEVREAPTRERRVLRASEVRVVKGSDGKPSKLVGYAAVFNQLSQPLMTKSGKMFVEKIDPGAFERSIADAAAGKGEIALFHAHNPNNIMARTSAKTLRLEEDPKGLRFEADLPDTTLARDVVADVDHGNIPGMSFGFDNPKDEWEKGKDGTFIRTLKDMDIGEVSTTPWPAYEGTTVESRSVELALERLEHDQPVGTAEERRDYLSPYGGGSVRSACRSAMMACRDAHDRMEDAMHTIGTRANAPNNHEIRAMRDMMAHVRNVRRKADELRSVVKEVDDEPDADDLDNFPPAPVAAQAGQNGNDDDEDDMDRSHIAILASATDELGLSLQEARALLPQPDAKEKEVKLKSILGPIPPAPKS